METEAGRVCFICCSLVIQWDPSGDVIGTVLPTSARVCLEFAGPEMVQLGNFPGTCGLGLSGPSDTWNLNSLTQFCPLLAPSFLPVK